MTSMSSSARPLLNRRLAEFGTTIFAEMSALAVRTGAINLGQGFPDTDGPEEVREAMTFHPVLTVDEVLAVALEPEPVPAVA